jgi:MEDS: MEthanogen/methylotroph, DcmR Sensory domain
MSEKPEVRLAGTALGRSRHVCAFFHTKDEEYKVLLPFIKEGFEQGDKAFHIVKDDHRPEHRRRLQQAGIAVDEAERKGQLEVRRWEDAYLREGRFDQNRMLALLEEVLQGARLPDHPAGRQHGVGLGGPPRRGRHRGVRNPAELRPAEVRRRRVLNV